MFSCKESADPVLVRGFKVVSCINLPSPSHASNTTHLLDPVNTNIISQSADFLDSNTDGEDLIQTSF